jgi:predicted RNA-binding protein with PIN domain
LEARLAATEEALRALEAEVAEGAVAEALLGEAPVVVPHEPSPSPSPSPSPQSPSLDVVGRAVADAAAAAEQLGRALAAAAAALNRADPQTDDPSDVVIEPPLPRAPRPRPSGPKRTPSPLPPAVFDDSVAAAEHLVRLNGVILLVDGYNISKLRWPELPIADQRRRLTDALGGLAARTGADVHAVFDGAEQADPTPPSGPRRLVRTSFSPPDVEADDVIIELVDALPLHRPVVVASSDRRVQDGASRRGANVISAPQLIAVLAR